MRNIFIFIFMVALAGKVQGQNTVTDSLLKRLEKTPEDTNRVNLLLNLANSIYFYEPAVSLEYSEKSLRLARRLNYKKGIVTSLNLAGESNRLTGNYPRALQYQLEALKISREIKNEILESNSLGFIGVIYLELNEYRQALQYFLPAIRIKEGFPATPPGIFILANTGVTYDLLKVFDSALHYLQLAGIKNTTVRHPQLGSLIPRRIGNVYMNKGMLDSALLYYFTALHNSKSSNESINLGPIQQKIAEVYEKTNLHDSSLHYGINAFNEAQRTSQKLMILESSNLLVRLYRGMGKYDSAFYYEDHATAMKDSLYGISKFKQLQLLMLDEQKRQQEITQAQERFRNRTRTIALSSAIGVFLIVAFILFRNNRQKQRANQELEITLSRLRSTQSQLIQSEKMASLGELTAGIAHEIQNPLNFVNNFSDVNRELIAEMKQELDNGDYESVKKIANDISENEEKINHHGQRADAIVKGMLQHSRTSSGQKEVTDINALVDEYLRLAYHGLRAKDKSFQAKFESDFDNSIRKMKVVPQDIGRVILNLVNNAFYAVNEKVKSETSNVKKDQSHISPFTFHHEPLVAVSTKNLGNKIEIRVKDNGNGIPDAIKEKIFQPFFTTKPAGQGTGLGLSLAYDIITNGHDGELRVESKKGVGSEFIISLPV